MLRFVSTEIASVVWSFVRPAGATSSVGAWLARVCAPFRFIPRLPSMRRRDWLLLFAAYQGAPDGLDPVRFQKGLFLFAQRSRLPKNSKYSFKPYDYGPMSPSIYSDLDKLVDEGFLERVAVRGKSWSRYKPTKVTFAEGERLLERAESEGQLDAARELFEIKQEVSSIGFRELLERVYTEHPEFAVNSVFRRTA
jgi:uncharacterized protein YwgA